MEQEPLQKSWRITQHSKNWRLPVSEEKSMRLLWFQSELVWTANGIGREGAKKLCEALKRNTTLRELGMRGEWIISDTLSSFVSMFLNEQAIPSGKAVQKHSRQCSKQTRGSSSLTSQRMALEKEGKLVFIKGGKTGINNYCYNILLSFFQGNR